MIFFSCCQFEMEAISRLPRQPSMKSRIRRFEIFKLVSNGNIRDNIPFWDVYGDIHLVCTSTVLSLNHPKMVCFLKTKYTKGKSKTVAMDINQRIAQVHLWYVQACFIVWIIISSYPLFVLFP